MAWPLSAKTKPRPSQKIGGSSMTKEGEMSKDHNPHDALLGHIKRALVDMKFMEVKG